jgi:hypothetical protein
MGGEIQTSADECMSSGLLSTIPCVEIREQFHHRIRDNRILNDEEFNLIYQLCKQAGKEWLKTEPKTFYFNGIRKLVDRWTK